MSLDLYIRKTAKEHEKINTV